MREITSFFGTLSRRIIRRLRYRALDAAEQKIQTTIDGQIDRSPTPKQQEQTEGNFE